MDGGGATPRPPLIQKIQAEPAPLPEAGPRPASCHEETGGKRIRYVAHRGQRILCVDYSGICEVEELERAADEATRRVHGEPRDSVVALLDLSGVPFGLRVIRKLGEAAAANVDYVRARAVVGLPESARATVQAIGTFSGRPIEIFPDVGAALNWLADRARG